MTRLIRAPRQRSSFSGIQTADPRYFLPSDPSRCVSWAGPSSFPEDRSRPPTATNAGSRLLLSAESDARSALDIDDPAAALGSFVAALREAYEEVGFPPGRGPIEKLERHLTDEPDKWLERCLELGVVLATDELVPAGRWVTPLGSPLRFDARFFVVRAPSGWEPAPDPTEVDGAHWATPEEALAELAAENAIMAPPTIEMLQRIDGHRDVSAILSSLRNVDWQTKGEVLRARLSPHVAVVLAPNPGFMTGPGTNTYVVGSGRTVVIDPAVANVPYLDSVMGIAGEVAAIAITHRHPDHIGGVAALVERTGAPVYAFGDDPVDGIRGACAHRG